MEKVNCKCEHLSDYLILCEHIVLAEGELLEVYIGPSGIYVISEPVSDCDCLYIAIRNLLGTSRFQLYIQDRGEYDAFSGAFRAFQNNEALSAAVNDYVFDNVIYFDEEARNKLCTALLESSNQNQGFFKDSNGTLFLSRHGKLNEISPHSSSLNFFLTLFGGVFGLHQFALHRYGLGILYLCTGGGFMIGWLMDLLFLFLGIQKDKQKRYLLPLEHRFQKLLFLPIGIVTGFLLFKFYISVSQSLGQTTAFFMNEQLRNSNPSYFENFYNTVRGFTEHLSN